MRKKLVLSLVAIVCIAVAVSVAFVGCSGKEKLIVFLGDSIAEGIAGASSPFTEREKYSYYGVVSMRNGLKYQNRSVSMHMSADMLGYIKQEDKDAKMHNTYIRTADILQVSILGNDFLLSYPGVSVMLREIVLNDDFTYVDGVIESANSAQNLKDIMDTLREMNPNARILMQTVYNPMFDGSPILTPTVMNKIKDERPGITAQEIRDYAGLMLDRLNKSVFDYAAANPGAIEILDVRAEFDRIFAADYERGKALIGSDGIHPSPEGHAVIADLTQLKLEELKLANKSSAIKKYRALRVEQLDRLYGKAKNADGASFDVKGAKTSVKKAKTCEDITKAYFDAIRGVTPAYLP